MNRILVKYAQDTIISFVTKPSLCSFHFYFIRIHKCVYGLKKISTVSKFQEYHHFFQEYHHFFQEYHHFFKESDLPSFHWLFFEHHVFAFLCSLTRLLLVEHDFSVPTSNANIVGFYNIPAQYY